MTTLEDFFDQIQPKTREEAGLKSRPGSNWQEPRRIPREEEVDRVGPPDFQREPPRAVVNEFGPKTNMMNYRRNTDRGQSRA